ncbi:MAG: 30S ribosomal protein S9 [Candidatus Omnitrophica bacterium]|nr:30S ribosomal protein S9 [Candidatus Omnitrophota bacterium]
MKKEKVYFGKGGRKEARANVKLAAGKGEIKINERKLEEYFPNKFLQEEVIKPLKVTESKEKFDILGRVTGGGINGQADALKLGIARALVAQDEKLREVLRKNDLLTRDPRMKERKKYGQKGARKKFQFTKR